MWCVLLVQFDDISDDYIDVKLIDNSLQFFTSQTFPNLQKNAYDKGLQYSTTKVPGDQTTYATIEISYQIKCTGDKDSTLVIKKYFN